MSQGNTEEIKYEAEREGERGAGQFGGKNEVPGGNGGRRTMVGGREGAKYEVRSTKYEVEIRRNSVARGVDAKPGRGGSGGAEVMGGEGGRKLEKRALAGFCML